ncbi:MAG: hypothetical protein KDA44_23500, partial [Planctomycetales bacterium]|nr:hypothetical protein [Planctomycetales bacterium]
NPVVFSIDASSTGAGSIAGDVLTITAPGVFVLNANQAGNLSYNDAPQIQRTLTVRQESLLVTTIADEDDGTSDPTYGAGTSLREAIAYANAHPGADTITFAAGVDGGTITVGNQLTLTETGAGNGTTITGPAAGITISGNNLTRVLQVNAGVVATVEGLTFADGYADQGGAIVNLGELTVRGGVFRENTADPGLGGAGGVGGAIASYGPLHIANSLFELNTAELGGGINSADGLTIVDSTFSRNQAGFNGGALRIFGSSTISSATFSGNMAGNGGGGLINHGDLTLTNSTFASNNAVDGGGLQLFEGSANLRHVTIASNTATGSGGGLVVNSAAVTLTNTIVAGNSAANQDDLSGALNPASNNNLLNQTAAAAGLGILADNGGPTQTIALVFGSPAINGGAAIPGINTDQRGVLRPFGTGVDIGAFESQFPLPSLNPQSQTVNEGAAVSFSALADGLFAGSAGNTLANDAGLLPGEFLLSPTHGYKLEYQTDGNLVLYRGDGAALWSSGTFGTTPGRAVMQADGNFVVYDSNNVPQFSTGTFGNPGAVLTLQDDGNLVIYGGSGPLFATNTATASPSVVPTVQWQVSTDNGATFADLSGETRLSLTFTATLADTGNQYRARFSNAYAADVPTTAATLTVIETTAPRVTGVLVSGPDWKPEFRAFVDPGRGIGYQVPVGDGDQLLPLPWVDTNQIHVVFSEPVNVTASDFEIFGVNPLSHSFTLSHVPGSATATLTFATPPAADKLLLIVHDTVTDLAGNRLDGEWENPTDLADDASSAFPSGDGFARGDFEFRLNVLHGDVDGNGGVNVVDRILTSQNARQTAGPPASANYDPRIDLNGDGGVNVVDRILASENARLTLPDGEPIASLPLLASNTSVGNAAAPALTQAELDRTVAAAVARLAATGLSAEASSALKTVEFQLADLPGNRLGIAAGGVVLIDPTAAGHGYFVDATPRDDQEFMVSLPGVLKAVSPAAVDRIDLLTVVLHELHHVLGTTGHRADPADLLAAELTLGERRLGELDAVFADAPSTGFLPRPALRIGARRPPAAVL